MDSTQVSYKHADRQWDVRLNVQTDEYLQDIVENIMLESTNGKFAYILIGGCEIGTKPSQDDYKVRHVHIAAIFHNRVTKASIIKNWGIVEGNGYYLVPRNRDLPYSGWKAHHTKEHSKVNPAEKIIFEAGELPEDNGKKRKFERSEAEKKETTDTVIKKMRKLIEEGKDDQAFETYPRTFLTYGERIKALVQQKKPGGATKKHPHIWIFGFPGTGKTAIMNYIYPRTYKKDLNNRFFDLYDDKVHDHIMLEDLDHQNVEKLGIQFLKTLCDESGFPIDQKYKTPQLTKSTILVTSNFTINDVVPEGKGVEETKQALHRRFLEVRVDDFLRLLGLKLIPPYERKQLKMKGNDDPKAIFMTWDYVRNSPTGEEVQDPDYYQDLILGYYYS
jgi:hypothetical protein